MNSAAMKSFTPRLTIIVLMLFVHASGQKLDEDLELGTVLFYRFSKVRFVFE